MTTLQCPSKVLVIFRAGPMNCTFLLTVLLFILCYNLFKNWEIPITLSFDPFEIVGGFPTLLDTFYEDYFEKNSTVDKDFEPKQLPSPILTPKFERWNCPISESSDKCISVLNSSTCLNSTQFSFNFWRSTSVKCVDKTFKEIACEIPFQKANICENVVVAIYRIGTSTTLELSDFQIGAQIQQEFLSSRGDFNHLDECQGYSRTDGIIFESNSSRQIFSRFGINSTNSGAGSGICNQLQQFNLICNCPNSPQCNIPIIFLTNCSKSSAKLDIYHSRGFIYAAILREQEFGKFSIFFRDIPQSESRNRFSTIRGRFHCPSEVTCPSEIFYPLSFISSLSIRNQLIILLSALFVSFIVRKSTKKNASK